MSNTSKNEQQEAPMALVMLHGNQIVKENQMESGEAENILALSQITFGEKLNNIANNTKRFLK